MLIPTGTLIALADGASFILMINDGNTEDVKLRTLQAEREYTPATHELEKDRPGTFQAEKRAHGSPESADLHEREETRFSEWMLSELESQLLSHKKSKLIIVSDPDTLGDLRKRYTQAIKSVLIAEIGKNLTGHPVPEIEKLLVRREV